MGDIGFGSICARFDPERMRRCAPRVAPGESMKPNRRQFMKMTACAVASAVAAPTSRAQSYPARPVRVVVPIAAGGANDVTGRIIAQWLSQRLGQQFIIENRPGAATNVGTEAVIRSPADGY